MSAKRSAVCRKLIALTWATGLLFIWLTVPSHAQVFSAGVKGGTPISEAGITAMLRTRGGSGPSTLNIRRYTIGPTVEVALPFRLRFQADFLYKRLDRTEHRLLGVSFGTITRRAANTWEFPMVLKYAWRYRGTRPFALAGGAFRSTCLADGTLGLIRVACGGSSDTLERATGN